MKSRKGTWPIALHVLRLEPGDLGGELGVVVRIVEARPVGPGQAIEGADRAEPDVLGDVVARELPQLGQRLGRGDHGGAGVEDEAVALPEIGASTGLVARLEHHRVDTRRLQPDREREPADPGADHHRTLHLKAPRIAATALPIGTGGLPETIRNRSSKVEWPA